MPRDDLTLAGLQALLDKLPSLDDIFFQANMTLKQSGIRFGDNGEVVFNKNGYTRGTYSKIYYAIGINIGEDEIAHFTAYVAPSAQTSANRKAVASIIQYFLSTESTIITRDVVAQPFESA